MPGLIAGWRRRVGALVGGFEAGPERTAPQALPALARASQHADRRGRRRHHGQGPLARAQQRLCRERHRELGRQCRGRRHQALLADRRRRAQGRGAAAVAGLDRRERCRGAHRLLRPAAPRRARGFYHWRGVLPVSSAAAGGWPRRAPAAADDPLGDAAADPERAAPGRQRHPPGDRARPRSADASPTTSSVATPAISPIPALPARRCGCRRRRSSTSSTRSMPGS